MASTCFTTLFVLLYLSVPTGAMVECYLCSWSTLEYNLTNYCINEKFQADRIGTVHCEMGCEVVSVRSSTDQLTNFYRNCAHTKVNNKDNDFPCEKAVFRDHSRENCICDWNLCNDAPSRNQIQWTFLAVAGLLAICLTRAEWDVVDSLLAWMVD